MALNFESSNAEVQACSTRHHTFSFCRGHFSRSALAWKLRALFLVGTELLPQVHWGFVRVGFIYYCQQGSQQWSLLPPISLPTMICDYHQFAYLPPHSFYCNELKKKSNPKAAFCQSLYDTLLQSLTKLPNSKKKKKSQNNCWLDRGDRQLYSACAYAEC